MTWSNLRDETQSERGNEKLSYGEEEIGHDEHPRRSLGQTGCGHAGSIESAELITRRIVAEHREKHQEEVGTACDTHTNGNLARGRDGLASGSEAAEDPHDDGGENNHEERIEGLPDFWSDGIGLDEVASEDTQ